MTTLKELHWQQLAFSSIEAVLLQVTEILYIRKSLAKMSQRSPFLRTSSIMSIFGPVQHTTTQIDSQTFVRRLEATPEMLCLGTESVSVLAPQPHCKAGQTQNIQQLQPKWENRSIYSIDFMVLIGVLVGGLP